ncbi:helix-turn-helix transcriptional regulator [Streptomyces sp. NRRL S-31]|uniref:helix-turn-helix transcriptional regulator n=1 Tax=Streptomyces sp. NRRL S-31 TaxID=1463898 RepID=UPI0004CAE1D5|nr:helix-turn-helix transcriptional regulator [Streptomyces sp. NRRL S-31]
MNTPSSAEPLSGIMKRALEYLAEGHGREATAWKLGVSRRTFYREADEACRQLGVRGLNFAALLNRAISKKLITVAPRDHVTLTKLQDEILHLIAAGYHTPEIAKLCGMSPSGAKYHVTRIARALKATNRLHAVALGWQCGILSRDVSDASQTNSRSTIDEPTQRARALRETA